MNGSKFVEFDVDGTALPDFYHLAQLFVADEYLVDFEKSLLEDEVSGIFENFL